VKGLPILLEAVAKLEGLTLDIAGDGPDRITLEEMAWMLNVSKRVRFFGFQSQRQVIDLLEDADIFVMTSFAEGVPVVLMEAMAAGIPVVATNIAGIPELIDHERSGLLIPPGDAIATANAIHRLVEDANLRNRLAISGRQKIERDFNIHIEARWLAKILASALGGATEEIGSLRPIETGLIAPASKLPAQ
jgi:glycosyltransferase involved in cell wall biosynthesis